MSEAIDSYFLTVWAMVASGLLLLVQLAVADVAAIRAKHRAGTPIEADFSLFHYRAARSHANTNESIVAFALFALGGMFSAASATWLGALAWIYVLARVAHMVAYYANRKTPRSMAFGVSLVALFGMFTVVATGLIR